MEMIKFSSRQVAYATPSRIPSAGAHYSEHGRGYRLGGDSRGVVRSVTFGVVGRYPVPAAQLCLGAI
jgi:hypothetical protein